MGKYPIGNQHTYEILKNSVPAFTYCFIDALAKSSTKNGISADDAYKIAIQLLLGSSKLISSESKHPWELIDMVCSPGGTTIEGIASLQKDAFESKVSEAFDSVI